MSMRRAEPEPAPPWYRQFWPWFLIALPSSAVVASAFTVYLAVREAPVLVVDDYAKIGLATHRKMARDRLATDLGLRAELYVMEEPGSIEIELTAADGVVQAASLRLSLLHPTLAGGDRFIELQPVGRRFVARLEEFPAQRMYVQLEPPDRAWRLTGELLPGERRISLVARK
jgi:hypothetical protein